MSDKEPDTPNMEEITVHGTKAWTYATVGGRDFKVHQDEEGDIEIQERTGENTWVHRYDSGYDTLAEAILNHAAINDEF
tara:strand:+ start:448 stop:684 length:237 start_codon:yes stop_codon:yes gene_type:complete